MLGLCLFGCAPDAAFLGFAWWLKFRSGWGTISLFLGIPNATFFGCASDAAFLGFAWWLQFRSGWGTISLFIVFRGSKSNVSRFLRLQFRNGLDAKHAGALPFRMRSRRSFLRLCLVAEVSQWLGHDFIVFRDSKRNVFRMRFRRSFLGLCLVAAVSQWLGHDFMTWHESDVSCG